MHRDTLFLHTATTKANAELFCVDTEVKSILTIMLGNKKFYHDEVSIYAFKTNISLLLWTYAHIFPETLHTIV